MKQYQDLQKKILLLGTKKPAAREGMPGTTSLFGHQMRFDLKEGFPIITTKEINFKHIVTELLWFLKGDTNIKFLVDNDCNIWNEDAYNYYVKLLSKNDSANWNPVYKQLGKDSYKIYSFKEFVRIIKETSLDKLPKIDNYTIGDCGKQYGWLWRNLKSCNVDCAGNTDTNYKHVDQLKELIQGLIENPLSRRHIINAWNPSTLDEMALHPCHALVQFNCRPLTVEQQEALVPAGTPEHLFSGIFNAMPKYYLDCQMYQRSADTFLGVPYNISSYSLLTILLCNLLNMVPGDFIHTFGDAHIYDNHLSQTNIQLQRKPKTLPKLEWSEEIKNVFKNLKIDDIDNEMKRELIIEILETMEIEDVKLKGYFPDPKIPAKLSTGLK